jgi:error-prone DNA polymerase
VKCARRSTVSRWGFSHIAERDRLPLPTSRLVLVERRVEREGEHAEVPIIHLIASRLIDRSVLLERSHPQA